MKKQLFKKASMKEIKNKSVLGSRFINAQSSYIYGYYEAAKSLVIVAIDGKYSNTKDTLVYPIYFNYRHYIELHLKSLIEDSEILYDKMDRLGYLKKSVQLPKVSDTLDRTHDLNKLLLLFKERLILISDEKFPKDIEKYIKQMHDSDKNGQKYRYHKNKNKNLYFIKEEQIDINNTLKIMEEVSNMLWAIGSHIDEYDTLSNSLILEMTSIYQDLNF